MGHDEGNEHTVWSDWLSEQPIKCTITSVPHNSKTIFIESLAGNICVLHESKRVLSRPDGAFRRSRGPMFAPFLIFVINPSHLCWPLYSTQIFFSNTLSEIICREQYKTFGECYKDQFCAYHRPRCILEACSASPIPVG